MSQPKYWIGRVRDTDDFGQPIADVFYDAKSQQGPWAIMSPASFDRHSMARSDDRLGTDLGQKYRRQSDGRWLKTGG